MNKPSVFIGSSAEGLKIAEILQELLDYKIETKLWTQNIFKPSSFSLKSLEDTLPSVNFGVFIFSPDDLLELRGAKFKVARDNVIFELGLFIGKLGYENCFIIKPRNSENFHLPSDLLGINVIDYNNERNDGDIVAALGSVSTKIKRVIEENSIKLLIKQKVKISSLRFKDIFWLNETGKETLEKKPDYYDSYIVAYDIVGFESLNKKFGEVFCDNILQTIDVLIYSKLNQKHLRIGDTFIFFINSKNNSSTLKLADIIKKRIINHNWNSLSNGLYINVSTSVCRYNESEDILSWLKRTFEHMKYVKSQNINEITFSTILPSIESNNYDFDIS